MSSDEKIDYRNFDTPAEWLDFVRLVEIALRFVAHNRITGDLAGRHLPPLDETSANERRVPRGQTAFLSMTDARQRFVLTGGYFFL